MSVDITSKEGREQCWLSRDAYWKCLDLNGEEQKKCINERERFERDCSKTWVALKKKIKFFYFFIY